MALVHLHIGTHKTGTSSLQRMMVGLRPMLRDRGVLYPESGIRAKTDGHAHLPAIIAGTTELYLREHKVKRAPYWEMLEQEIKDARAERVILSSESFDRLTGPQVARVAESLKGHDVRVVVYLRNQLDYMISYYKFLLEFQYPYSFTRCLQDYGDRCDFAALLDRWTSAFGSDAVQFRLFDRVKRQPGLARDFLQIVGISELVPSDNPSLKILKNLSPSDPASRMLRSLNVLESWLRKCGLRKVAWWRLRRALFRDQSLVHTFCRCTAPVLTPPLVREADVAALRERTGAYNERFFPLLESSEDEALFAF